mgnify:CR=1 FL=1
MSGTDERPLPFSNPRRYVQEHRDDLIYLLLNGEPYVRGVAMAVLIEGGGRAEIDQVIRELQLARELDPETREKVIG